MRQFGVCVIEKRKCGDGPELGEGQHGDCMTGSSTRDRLPWPGLASPRRGNSLETIDKPAPATRGCSLGTLGTPGQDGRFLAQTPPFGASSLPAVMSELSVPLLPLYAPVPLYAQQTAFLAAHRKRVANQSGGWELPLFSANRSPPQRHSPSCARPRPTQQSLHSICDFQ